MRSVCERQRGAQASVLHHQDGGADGSDGRPESDNAENGGGILDVLGPVILVIALQGGALGEGAVQKDGGSSVDLGDIDDALVKLAVVTVLENVLPVVVVLDLLAGAYLLLGATADDGVVFVLLRRLVVVVMVIAVRVGVRAGNPVAGPETQSRTAEKGGLDGAAGRAVSRRIGNLGAAAVELATAETGNGAGTKLGVATDVTIGFCIVALTASTMTRLAPGPIS